MPHAAWITVLAQRWISWVERMKGRIGVRVAFGLRYDEGRPGGRPIWRAAVEYQLLLADELHPETRRAKNRPCGL
jgi:hypothetical protein